MKRLLLLVFIAVLALGAFAAPAWAWYAPQEKTAYIDGFTPVGWVQWKADDPYNVTFRDDPIPRGWPVFAATTWYDFNRPAVTMAPLWVFNSFAFSREGGCATKSVLGCAGVRLWSPVYAMGEQQPGAFARDWWVPIGRAGSKSLPSGHYTGWFREVVPRAIPTWTDDEGNELEHPVMFGPWDSGRFEHEFDVK